jgi:hypothetical protein
MTAAPVELGGVCAIPVIAAPAVATASRSAVAKAAACRLLIPDVCSVLMPLFYGPAG